MCMIRKDIYIYILYELYIQWMHRLKAKMILCNIFCHKCHMERLQSMSVSNGHRHDYQHHSDRHNMSQPPFEQ